MSISYSSGYVSKIEHYNKNGILLNYVLLSISSYRINTIRSFLGNSTSPLAEASFTYDSSYRLIDINDVNAGIGSAIQYSSNDEVVKVTHRFNGDPDKQKFTTYDYSTFQTIVTDYTGFVTNYYFDYYGRCKSIIDCEGKSITRNYQELSINNPGMISGESKLQINERNIIENNSFDSSDNLFDNGSSWQLISGSASDIKIVDGGVYGQRCLRIDKVGTSNVELRQIIKNPSPGYYTFKTFLKSCITQSSGALVGNIKAIINVKYREKVVTTSTTTDKYYNTNVVSKTEYFDRSNDYELTNMLSGNFDWTAYEKSGVYIPSGSAISNVQVELKLVFTGSNYTAYVDDLSLSYGDHMVRYNYVNNGYFENNMNGWSITNGDSTDGVVYCASYETHSKILGENVLRISSSPKILKKLNRTIKITGDSGDELLFTMFGKGIVTKNDVFKAYVKIHYIDTNTLATHEFDFDTNYENWQVLTRKIIIERAYDYVEIGALVQAQTSIYLDAIQLYKDSFGKEYSYTEKKSLTQMVDASGTSAEVAYDANNNVTEATDESGDTYRYSYDKNKQVVQITNNQNARVLFTYEDGHKTSTKLVSSRGDKLITREEYDDLGQVISQTDDFGSTTEFEYDAYGRKLKQIDANGMTTRYSYNSYNQLIEQLSVLGTDKSKCSYTYDSQGKITSIKADNNSQYDFTYTCDQQVAEIKVNGNVFVKNNYTKTVNGINTNLLTKQMLGSSESNGVFTFNYDHKQRLTSVRFNNVEQVRYIYDEKNQVTEIYDCVNGIRQYLSYDSNGNIINVTDTDKTVYSYEYDNLGNLQKGTQIIDNIIRSYDYEYKCEFNDYTPSGYFTRLQRAFPDEVIKGGSGINGIYGGKASLNTVRNDVINVTDDSPLGDYCASLSFKRDNAVVSYDMSNFNTTRKPESSMKKTFKYDRWKNNLKKHKTAFAWIKPSGSISGDQRILAFASGQVSQGRFRLYAKTDGSIAVIDSLEGNPLVSNTKLIMDEWNLIGFRVDENIGNTQKTLTLVVNNEIKTKIYNNTTSMEYLNWFIMGAPSDSLSIGDLYTLSKKGSLANSESYPINMAFRVAYASVGSTEISNDDFKGIYAEGNKYLKHCPNFGSSGVTYYNHDVYKRFDVVSLNGSLISAKRMRPKVHSFTEASFKVEKSRMFKYDNEGDDSLNRHVYASYDSLINLNKGNPSKLAYDLLLKNQGTISVRFKIDSNVSSSGERTIIYSTNNGIQRMKAYLDGTVLKLQVNSTGTIHSVCNVSKDEWNQLVIRYSGTVYDVFVNNTKYVFNDVATSLDNALTYIGCSVDSSKKPVNHLNGFMEMLAFTPEVVTDNELCNIYVNGNSYSIRTEYDELGRSKTKSIHSKNHVLSKNYKYLSNGTYTTTKIENEENYLGNKISYAYDDVGNVTVKTKHNGNRCLDNRQYEYDGLSRLIKSIVNGVTSNYTYDSNNNIKSKNGVTYTYDSVIKDRLVSRSDGTQITYADAFIGNPTRIIMPGKTMNLTWNGRRLKSINSVSYSYNQDGIRIGKTVSGSYNEKYYLEGDRIASLKRQRGTNVERLDFVYDEAQMLVGLSYNGNEYFYDRSVDGEINSIIASDGTKLVEYKYDDWGKPVSIGTDGSVLGNKLKQLNPFMYKGYFYDYEFGLYYLKSRYYDPELGRFISADSEVGTVGNTMGMNLYAYCKCNPINYADENGNWPSWATKLCIGLAVIAVCAIVAVATAGTGTACLGMSMLVGAAKGAAIGAIQGAVTGAVIGAVTEGIKTKSWEGAWKGALSGAVNGAADGFMFGAIGGAISGALNPKFCFVAGTMVMTNQGLKAIEEIQKGDLVLSYNSNLGIYDYKDVVDLYVNKTDKLCHIKTENDEIVCTPNHSILTHNGWKQAKEITTDDYIVSHDQNVRVISTKIEYLNEFIPVYNLNVLGYHTYVIGKDLVVVHNSCSADGTGNVKYKSGDESRKAAFRHAKRDLKIPMNQQPSKVIQSVNRQHKVIPGRTYIFDVGNNKTVQIMEHIGGHPEFDILRSHFNTSISHWHYFF